MIAPLKVLAKSLTTTLIVLVVAEAFLRGAYTIRNSMVQYIPLPYALGDDYGPIPPWLDRLLILLPDNYLIWTSAPNAHRTYVDVFSPVRSEGDRIALLRRFAPTLPAEFRANPRWEISLNSHGDRNPEVTDTPHPSTIRIACIGDSWTFGMNVNQDQTYPRRLAARLGEQQPAEQFEVINFGVLGYSSFQGLQLLKRRVLDLHPNVVAIGFGMNDSDVAGSRDKDNLREPGPSGITTRLTDAVKDFEFYKLLRYTALVVKFRPRTIGDYLKEESGAKESGVVNYEELEPWTRVSPHDFDQNIREMIRLVEQRGATAVLLDNELWGESPYRPILRKISTELEVPLVDSYSLLAHARTQIEGDLETRLDLAPRPEAARKSSGNVTMVFRVSRGAVEVPERLSIVGTDPQLGGLIPNTVAMYDDGTHGDQRAGDGVWSYSATFRPGAHLSYVYTNSGRPGAWEGLDVPHVRSVQVPAANEGAPVYLPIETFGHIYMLADNWHTDATGYDLIARAVTDAIIQGRHR